MAKDWWEKPVSPSTTRMRYTGSPLEHGSKLFPDTPAYDVKAHLAYVQELHAKYPLNTIEKIDVHISELIAELNPRPYALACVHVQRNYTDLSRERH